MERQGYETPSKLSKCELSYYSKIKHEDPYQQVSNTPVRSVNLCFDLADLKKVQQMRDKIMKEHTQNYKTEKGYIDEHSKNYPPSQCQLLAEK